LTDSPAILLQRWAGQAVLTESYNSEESKVHFTSRAYCAEAAGIPADYLHRRESTGRSAYRGNTEMRQDYNKAHIKKQVRDPETRCLPTSMPPTRKKLAHW